jgi:hypothetical protein
VDESRVVWRSPIGENARIEANNVHFDVTWRPEPALRAVGRPSAGPQAPAGTTTTEIRARSDRVSIAVPGGTLGPWRVDIDRTPGTSRVRVAFDPGVPDACTLLVVGDGDRTTTVDLRVPRSPLARLGVPPALLGLHGGGLQIETNAHYSELGPQRADAAAKGGLYGIEAGLPRPLDVAWDVAAMGDARAGLDLKKARLAAGPLVGTMTGMLKTFDDGFRIDLAWSAGPVPCTAFDTPLDESQPFDFGYQLRKVAQASGITKVKGEVRARGALVFDSRDLSTSNVDFTPEMNCEVSLFGR